MNYLTYTDNRPSYPLCVLVPVINGAAIGTHYLKPHDINYDEVLVLSLHQAEGKKKTPVKEIKAYIQEELIEVFEDNSVEYLIVGDADYFKALAGEVKVEANLGYVLDCVYGPWKVVYVPNFRASFYDPETVANKIAQGMNALIEHRSDSYLAPGSNIIHSEYYPETYDQIKDALDQLLEANVPLSIDIEAFSLRHHTAGIGTISFAWDQHNGIAFAVDYEPILGATEAPYGNQGYNGPVRELLKDFFIKFTAKTLYHNITYDAYVMIYQLFMEDLLDNPGLLRGLKVMLKNWHDTKIIAYLATNSCSGNNLSLKDQAQAFAGNYAQEDIKDIRNIPLHGLLRYNLVDSLSTWYVYNKHWDTVINDQQLEVYETIFQPACVDVTQMQLTGLPLNMNRVKEVKKILEHDENSALAKINSSNIIKDFTWILREDWAVAKNEKLKVKRVTASDSVEEFNPGSGQQLQKLLFDYLQLPILGYTKSKQPSTKAGDIKALRHHTSRQDVIALLDALLEHKAVNKILNTFIPAFEQAAKGKDGWHYLFGNFNLGGTVSGRLSSSGPNLQNLPSSGTKYAKVIKSCFQAKPGWIFVGLDFSSLEDRISAVTTKDKNKLKVYVDGFDGHCLRAFAYYPENMPDIVETVESINSIAKVHKSARQDSKEPTFLMTYGGTYHGLMRNCGFSEEKAKRIENRFLDLYADSVKWVQDKLNQASKDGYVTVAFGLRVRTPLLKQVVRGNSKTPYEAEAEGRTAGNALGQSWGLLNNRAASEYMAKVRDSEFAHDILPGAHIHDAQYYTIRDDMAVVQHLNTHLVKAVQWQDHPEIYHDEVKLGGELSLFFPSWEHELTIPNGATDQEIRSLVETHMHDLHAETP